MYGECCGLRKTRVDVVPEPTSLAFSTPAQIGISKATDWLLDFRQTTVAVAEAGKTNAHTIHHCQV